MPFELIALVCLLLVLRLSRPSWWGIARRVLPLAALVLPVQSFATAQAITADAQAIRAASDNFASVDTSAPTGLLVSSQVVSFGTSPVGVPATLSNASIAVFNNSAAPITINALTVTPSGTQNDTADFTIVSTTCVGYTSPSAQTPQTLAPQASCVINPSFTPSRAGRETVTLNVTNNSPVSSVQATLTGLGVAATQVLQFSPSNAVFANQPVGFPSNPQYFYVYNVGSVPLTVSSVVASGDFSISNQYCTATPLQPYLNGSYSCYVGVVFTPSALGTRTGTVSFYDTASGSPQMLSLVGTGIAADGALQLETPSLSFPAQPMGITSSDGGPVLLVNTGNVPVRINSVDFTGDFGLSYGSDCLTEPIAPGAVCNIDVTFTPTKSSGTETGRLTIASTAGSYIVPLQGIAEPATQAIGFTPTSLNVGQLQTGQTSITNEPIQVWIRNTGTETVTFKAPDAISGDFTIVNDGCNPTGTATLGAGFDCEIDIGYTAPSTPGAFTGKLTLKDSAGTQSLSLSGTAVATLPPVQAYPQVGAFEQVAVGNTGPYDPYDNIFYLPVTFTNNTASTINFVSSTLSSNFSLDGNNYCIGPLPAGQSCIVGLVFAPLKAGYLTGTFQLKDDKNVTYTVPLAGYAPPKSNSASIGPDTLIFPSVAVLIPPADANPNLFQTIGLANGGTATFNVGQVAVNPSTDFTIQTDFCSDTALNPPGQENAGCYIQVAFTPGSTGPKDATISFPITFADNSTTTLTATVSGTGVAQAPHATLTPTAVTFVNQTVGVNYPTSGANPPATLTLTNDGNVPLTPGVASTSDTADFSLATTGTGNTCSGNLLQPASSCSFQVTFHPASAGAKSATLSVPVQYVTGSAAALSAKLSGNGVAASTSLTITPQQAQFPNQVVNTYDPQQALPFTLTNYTNAPVTLGKASTGPDFTLSADTCSGKTLNPYDTCTASVEFTPTTSTPTRYNPTHYTGALSIPLTSGTILKAYLSGWGIPPSQQLAFSPSTVNFGTVKAGSSSPAQIALLVNQGSTGARGAVPIDSITLGGNNSGDFSFSPGCAVGGSLQGRSSCPLTVVFSPQASSSGVRTATVTVTYLSGYVDGYIPVTSTVVLGLSGTAD